MQTGSGSMLSPAQLEERKTGITATDVAAIVGVHPHRSAVDVWQEKRGDAPPFIGNDRTKWGNLLEPVIRADYEHRRGVRVEVHGTMTHPEIPWLKATPDGLVYEGTNLDPDRGLEIKCHTIHLAHIYGAPGSDEVPPHELCQVAWNMAATGLERWDLVAFIDGQTIDYTIDRDDELIGMLQARAERFRIDCVLGGEPPPPDGSDAYTAWLNARNRGDNALAALEAVDQEPAVLALVDRLRELRDQIAAREAEEGIVVQSLKARIGNAAGIDWPSDKPARGKKPARDRITWKKAKDGRRTDLQAVITDLRNYAALITGAHTETVQRACTALDKMAEHTFANTRATITALDVRSLLVGMLQALQDIASDKVIERHTVPTIGSRRFVVPRHWKASGGSDSGADS